MGPDHRGGMGGTPKTTTSRRDRRGRRIGRNWWRELCVDTWRCAYDAWLADLEAASNGWTTEADEYRAIHPTPTFKQTLIGLAS